MKRTGISSLLVAILLAAWTPIAAAHGPAQEILPSVDYEYGGALHFQAGINSPLQVLRAALFLRRGTGETSVFITNSPAESQTAFEITIEVAELQLLPFSRLVYWWQFDLADGSNIQSIPSTLLYEDNRYAWQVHAREGVRVHWTGADLDRGQAILDLTSRSLAELHPMGLTPPESLEVYVYPSPGELQASLRLGGIPSAAAHTLPELGVVLVSAASSNDGLQDLERQIPHEITHLLLYQRMGASYYNLPAWLNEGFATLQESSPAAALRLALEEALASDATLPLSSLCASFPVENESRILAYAQSASFVQYLLDVYGSGGVVRLLDAYQEGASCEGAIQRVYQRPLSQLEAEWLQTLSGRGGQNSLLSIERLAWIALPALLLISASILLLVLRIRRAQAKG